MFWVTYKNAAGRNVSEKVATRTAVWHHRAQAAQDADVAEFRVRRAAPGDKFGPVWEDVSGQF
jgi:hypothetical protein